MCVGCFGFVVRKLSFGRTGEFGFGGDPCIGIVMSSVTGVLGSFIKPDDYSLLQEIILELYTCKVCQRGFQD